MGSTRHKASRQSDEAGRYQAQDGEGAPTGSAEFRFGTSLRRLGNRRSTFQPPHIRIHHMEGVVPVFVFGVGFLQLHEVALADVPGVGVAQVSAEQVQGKGVAFHVFDQLLEFVHALVAVVQRNVPEKTTPHSERLEQMHTGGTGEARELFLAHGLAEESAQGEDVEGSYDIHWVEWLMVDTNSGEAGTGTAELLQASAPPDQWNSRRKIALWLAAPAASGKSGETF